MIIEHREDIISNFKGTIIDTETIGEFLNQYSDSRRYKDIQLVIFGFINRHTLHIFCAIGIETIDKLKDKAIEVLDGLKRPFYAFNSEFERGVFFHQLGKKINFDGELQRGRESKAEARSRLGIPNYDDPFFDDGYLCKIALGMGHFDKAIAHNRACCLKERDILIKEGFRKPDELKFIK